MLHRKQETEGACATYRAYGSISDWRSTEVRNVRLNGTHHGVDPKYLQPYLDEFVFRFNRRKTPMAAFQTLLGIATCKSPQTLTDLKEP